MATRQVTSKKTTTVSVEKAAPRVAAPVIPARATKPRTPRAPEPTEVTTARVKTVKHSKAAVAEPVRIEPSVVKAENPHQAISTLAYGYWIARDFQPGDPAADWLRAEAEYLSRS